MYSQIMIGEYGLPTYSLFVIIGFCISFFVLSRFLLKQLIFRKYIYICLISCFGMSIFAKLFGYISYIITVYQQSGRLVWKDGLLHSGIVYLGGLFGYLLTLRILCKFRNRSWKEIRNPISIAIPLFHGFGRIGCYLAGCCYGEKSDSWFAFPYRTTVTGYIWENRFPVQLMEAVFEFTMFFSLLQLYKRNPFDYKKTSFLKLYLCLYSIWRFVIEFLRGDEQRGVFGIISFSQVICICIMGWLGTKIIIRFRRQV